MLWEATPLSWSQLFPFLTRSGKPRTDQAHGKSSSQWHGIGSIREAGWDPGVYARPIHFGSRQWSKSPCLSCAESADCILAKWLGLDLAAWGTTCRM